MKKLAIAVCLLTFSIQSYSQDEPKKSRRESLEQLTPEQRNELQVKKMTLDLDLTASQQKEMAALIKEESAKRDAKKAEMKANAATKKELTTAEKFELRSKMMDAQIEHKAKMKKILNKEQYEKWETSLEKREHHFRNARREKRQVQHTEESK